MKKIALLILLALYAAAGGNAQTVTGSFTASSAACVGTPSCLIGQVGTLGSSSIVIGGTFVGTVSFEQTADNVTWIALTVDPAAGGAGVTSATAGGTWIVNVAALNRIRVRPSAYTSGTITARINFSPAFVRKNVFTTTPTFASMTAGQVFYAGTGGLLSGDADLTFTGGNTLNATNFVNSTAATFSTMTSGSVLFAGTAGLLSQNNANLFFSNTAPVGLFVGPRTGFDTLIQNTYVANSKNVFGLLNALSATQAYGVQTVVQDSTTFSGYGAFSGIAESTNTSGTRSAMSGGNGEAYHTGTGGTVNNLQGVSSYAAVSAGTVPKVASFDSNGVDLTGGTLTHAIIYGAFKGVAVAGATVTNAYGVKIETNTRASGTLTNNYGLKIENQSAGATINSAITTGTGTVNLGDTVFAPAFQGSGTIPSVATCGTIGTGSKNFAGFITSTATGACVAVVTFSKTATTGWSCGVSNGTTANIITQTGSSTTTATFTGTTVTGDVLRYTCGAYYRWERPDLMIETY